MTEGKGHIVLSLGLDGAKLLVGTGQRSRSSEVIMSLREVRTLSKV